MAMIIAVFLIFKFLGKKFNNEFCVGMQFAIKFVEADANNIKKITNIVKRVLLNLPMISVGFVKILSIS